MTHNSSVNFKLTHFLLWTKGSHQSTNFWDFQVLRWKFAIFLMLFSKPHVSFSSNFASLFSTMKDKSSLLFWSNVIHFGEKEPIKVEILRISSAQVKIHQILLIFETTYQFFLQILHHSSVSWDITPLYSILVVSNMTWGIWQVFTQPLKSLKISFR